MDILTYAAAMEKSLADTMSSLRGACSPELSRVVDLLLGFQGEFERLMIDVKALTEDQPWPELATVDFVGADETWRDLTSSISPAAAPLVTDYTALWCIHTLLDKSTQFYQQAATQSPQAQARLFYSSVSELKLILRRRIDGVERVVANQVWKAIGFPPGLLGKE